MSNEETSNEESVLEDAQFDAEDFNKRTHSIARPHGVIGADPSAINEAGAPPIPEKDTEKNMTFTQWALAGNGRFTPAGVSVEALPPGVYEPYALPGSWGLESLKLSSDEIYELPDMATNAVLQEAETFWNNESRYRKHDLLYKRGIMLYGPPGAGKSVTIKLLIRKLIERDGIVLLVNHVPLAIMCLKALKRIEAKRNLICIFEDIDEIIVSNGEAAVLSMLDGEHNVDRVMNIATTNYPDKLGARIINRPSRFDRRVLIGMPSDEAREFYLSKTTGTSLNSQQLKQWVVDTKDMSIAHLRELVVAVYCLDQPYDDVIARLKEMAKGIKVSADFKNTSMGFLSDGLKKN